MVNDGEMIVVECKSSLSIDDVNEHLTRLGKVKKLFPKYRDMKVMGAVAAMVMQDNVPRYAYKKGLPRLRLLPLEEFHHKVCIKVLFLYSAISPLF